MFKLEVKKANSAFNVPTTHERISLVHKDTLTLFLQPNSKSVISPKSEGSSVFAWLSVSGLFSSSVLRPFHFRVDCLFWDSHLLSVSGDCKWQTGCFVVWLWVQRECVWIHDTLGNHILFKVRRLLVLHLWCFYKGSRKCSVCLGCSEAWVHFHIMAQSTLSLTPVSSVYILCVFTSTASTNSSDISWS